jgi:hypothetical protein
MTEQPLALRIGLPLRIGWVTMDWIQILFVIILVGIATELAHVVKAIGATNRLLAALLKHVKPV